MRIVFYISGHGLGHATRDIELIKALRHARPDARVFVRTTAPRSIFERTAPVSIGIAAVKTDTGMVQIDSLRIDEEETARQAAAFYATFDARVKDEAAVIGRARANVVLGDIPPLAFAAADRAGVPSIAIGNFTWDWIYGIYAAFDTRAPGVLDTMRRAYATATRALRLPLHGGFEPMAAVVRDIPFIARRSARDRAETRRRLGIADDRPAVLVSFNEYGVDIPIDVVRQSTRFSLVPTDGGPPGLEYQDLVAASDVVISKPGYGIISECIANGAALLYTSRGRFIEYDLLVAEMPRLLRCRYLSQEDLRAGRWADAIDALLAQPPPAERPRIDGAELAAREILAIG